MLEVKVPIDKSSPFFYPMAKEMFAVELFVVIF